MQYIPKAVCSALLQNPWNTSIQPNQWIVAEVRKSHQNVCRAGYCFSPLRAELPLSLFCILSKSPITRSPGTSWCQLVWFWLAHRVLFVFRICISQFYSQWNVFYLKSKLKTLNHKSVDLSVSRVFLLRFVDHITSQEQIAYRSYGVTSVVRFIVNFLSLSFLMKS